MRAARSELLEAVERASLSGGRSDDAIHACVLAELQARGGFGGVLVDVGCGSGALGRSLNQRVERYVGVDLVQYDGFPREPGFEFVQADLNGPLSGLGTGAADAVVSVETIEHLENPRAFMRELVRLAKPGGVVVVTTPNQLSLLSKLTLLVKNQFQAFQEAQGQYPTHITALLECDLERIAREVGLVDVRIRYTNQGRIPGTARHWPRQLGFGGRTFSDNVLVAGRRPGSGSQHLA